MTLGRQVFRRRGTAAFGLLAVTGIAALGVDGMRAAQSLGDASFGALILAVLLWVCYSASITPAVITTRDHLIVRQPFWTWKVRWASVRYLARGTRFEVVIDARRIRVWAFSHSPMADFRGDPQRLAAAAEIGRCSMHGIGGPRGASVIVWPVAVSLAVVVLLGQALLVLR